MINAIAVDRTADRAAIDRALEGLAARYAEPFGTVVGDAVRYGLLGGGKRLRGLLFLSAYRATLGEHDASAHAPELAAAIEVVHAYSLVHDDLPCMDDDDVRRGRPTVHRVYGVRAATAAGVAMVPLAALAAFDGARAVGLSPRDAAGVVKELMRASGGGGMIGGQLCDLEGEARPLQLEELERIHRSKTGALIRASMVIGGLASRCDARRLDALARYGDAVGLAFQIADDVLDVTATSDRLGKTAGRDVDLRKSTYPALLGVDGATERAAALAAEACAALEQAGILSRELEALAHFAVERES